MWPRFTTSYERGAKSVPFSLTDVLHRLVERYNMNDLLRDVRKRAIRPMSQPIASATVHGFSGTSRCGRQAASSAFDDDGFRAYDWH